jgi:DNA polymerase (family X)
MRSAPSNAELASALTEYAALLELGGANAYSYRAYRRAADLIRTTPAPVADLVRAGRARTLSGIGRSIEARLRELVDTGAIAELESLRRTTAVELAAFGRLHGLSAARLAAIGAELGIHTVAELREAAAAGRVGGVNGVGPQTEAAIVAALEAPQAGARHELMLDRARTLAEAVAERMGGLVAGEPRRWAERPGRLVVVVASDDPREVERRFAALPELAATVAPTLGITVDGTPVELVVCAPPAMGTALLRATGAPGYVAALEPLPEAENEQAVYDLLGASWVPPELREPGAPDVPLDLLDEGLVRGDLHCHTTWSDGRASVVEMAEAARLLGHDYIAVCDHTTAVGVVAGLDADGVRRQAAEIEAANARMAPFRILRGVECDILPDGSLDLPDEILAELDWVQISLHAGQRAPRSELTARVTHAMRHPAACCLSHPTGRILGHRPENALDLELTIEVALETGVALEVNGLPSRLDLAGDHVRAAVAAGVAITCSSDAHSPRGLQNIVYAVHTARRGGAPAPAVLNTRPAPELRRFKHRALLRPHPEV